jgi:SMC interacting uncharacterized protein involved in chromosome segregation
VIDPGVVNAIANLGATGLLIIALWAFATDRIVTGSRLKASEQKCEERTKMLESKLDAGAGVVERQAEALQGQIDALKELLKMRADVGK